MVHFTGLLENARHPVAGALVGDPCKNRVRAGIGGWPGTATGGQIHVVHISHTHPPKEIIQALRKYLLGKKKPTIQPVLLVVGVALVADNPRSGPLWGQRQPKTALLFNLDEPFFPRRKGCSAIWSASCSCQWCHE